MDQPQDMSNLPSLPMALSAPQYFHRLSQGLSITGESTNREASSIERESKVKDEGDEKGVDGRRKEKCAVEKESKLDETSSNFHKVKVVEKIGRPFMDGKEVAGDVAQEGVEQKQEDKERKDTKDKGGMIQEENSSCEQGGEMVVLLQRKGRGSGRKSKERVGDDVGECVEVNRECGEKLEQKEERASNSGHDTQVLLPFPKKRGKLSLQSMDSGLDKVIACTLLCTRCCLRLCV